MSVKTFVLDTNILLHDPNAPLHFEDNTVLIPLAVVKELDNFKTEMTERGRSARTSIRLLDELRRKGNLSTGVKMENNGTLRVESDGKYDDDADQQLLALAKRAHKSKAPTIVVTKDINLRIQADVAGVSAEDYETSKVEVDELYTGHRELEVDDRFLANFRSSTGFPVPVEGLNPNEYVLLSGVSKAKLTAMGRVSSDGTVIKPLIGTPRELNMVMPKNKEQHFLMDALLDPNISLVTVIGRAGSGKTLLSVAAGYYLTIMERKYMKMLVTRPTVPMGRDIGFLPGEISSKLDPWMQPIYDALDLIADALPHNRQQQNPPKGKDRDRDRAPQPQNGHMDGKKLMETSSKIAIEPLTYIRGRSIHRQFLIADEAQSLTPLEIKTILTRAGPGTKVILTGDIYQIDNPYVDAMSNGLSHAVELFRKHGIAAHITLQKGVRSPLASLASEVM